MSAFTKAELVACVDRELAQRSRVYAHRIAEKKMSQKFADEEMAKMRAVRSALVEHMPEDKPPPQGGLFG